MTSIAKLPTDYTVTPDGKAFVSQREVERLLSFSAGTISRFVQKHSQHLKLNGDNQLDDKSLVFVSTYYAKKGNKQAITLLGKFAEAGARAFVYSQVGYDPRPTLSISTPILQQSTDSLELKRLQATTQQANRKTLATVAATSHATLMHWVAKGYIDAEIKTRREWKYTVTDHGKSLGFTQNHNGTVFPPTTWGV